MVGAVVDLAAEIKRGHDAVAHFALDLSLQQDAAGGCHLIAVLKILLGDEMKDLVQVKDIQVEAKIDQAWLARLTAFDAAARLEWQVVDTQLGILERDLSHHVGPAQLTLEVHSQMVGKRIGRTVEQDGR